MVDRLKQIPKQLLDWWNKFTAKQKTIIVCVAAGVLTAFAILGTILMQPQYELLATCESTKEASAITELLDSEELDYTLSDNGLVINILKDQLSTANLLLGANDIPLASYAIENVFDGGFSTTEADKLKKYKLYCESGFEEDFSSYSFVKSASVTLEIPENDGTLISSKEESYASIILDLAGEVPADAPAAMAKFVATALGNDSVENITIIDTEGNLLFSGEDTLSTSGNASTQLTVKQQAENILTGDLKEVLIGTNLFSNIEVSPNLVIDFSTVETTEHLFEPAEGSDQGVLSHESLYESDSTSGTSGIPGTDSNTETTYVYQDSEQSSSTVTERDSDYLPNETIKNLTIPPGLIKYSDSSIAVSTITYNVLNEDDAKSQGLLDGITWEEYKLANSERIKMEVDPDLYSVVAKATGIAEDNIQILSYEEPWFVDSQGLGIETADVIQIVLIVIILGLLAFVVLRSMRTVKSQEREEELSVETLLQSAPENDLEDIGLETKSETRRIVEKFVDENPEAVAHLLRNWLSEDWG